MLIPSCLTGRRELAAPQAADDGGEGMKAITQDKYGSELTLEFTDIDKPEIGEGDVLIRIRAAGVNPADWAIMSGLPYIARPVYGARKPKDRIRGTDVAGTVEVVGSGVTRFKLGDEVFGWCKGSFAEYASAAEDALALKPSNISFEQAASVPLAGLVALQALRKGDVGSGHNVLINGASGGIGTFAVQIAKSLGAHVTGVCSTRNVEARPFTWRRRGHRLHQERFYGGWPAVRLHSGQRQ